MKERKTFLEDKMTRQVVIDSLCNGITNVSEFLDNVNYLIDEKINKDITYLDYNMYDGEDNVLLMVLPTFRRVWSKVYINLPTYFYNTSNGKKDKTRELYQASFSADEFYEYFINTLKKTNGCLYSFENIDRTQSHVTLIVDDYISYLIDKIINCENPKQILRDSKLRKLKFGNG